MSDNDPTKNGVAEKQEVIHRQFLIIPLCAYSLLSSTHAAANAPITHQHDSRQHTHPLPAQGIYHRHGNTAYGQYINRGGSITGTLTPPRSVTQQPTPLPQAQRGTISGTLQQGTQPRVIQGTMPSPSSPKEETAATKATNTQQAPTPQSNRHYTKAWLSCERTARDCNVCATNVQQQFNRAANGQISWRTESWHFGWDIAYPPEQIRARDLFAGQKKYLLGIPAKHVQGFIHTNSPQYPFAASHSHRSRGGIMLINQNVQGEKHLAALFKSRSKHPSGVHAIGQYLAYGEQGKLWLKDLTEPSLPDIGVALPGPTANFGGGLGLVKLAGNGHLLVTTGPGGQAQGPRFNRFYHLRSHDGKPGQLTFLQQSPQQKPAQWPAGFQYAENLSLISECGSGDIYAVHTTGDQDGINAIRGQGYWRLSKIVQHGQQLSLQPLIAFTNQQSMDKCSMRAAATVRVNPDKQLEFYCHGYAKNPGGSTLNVLGKSKNTFKFKVGVPR